MSHQPCRLGCAFQPNKNSLGFVFNPSNGTLHYVGLRFANPTYKPDFRASHKESNYTRARLLRLPPLPCPLPQGEREHFVLSYPKPQGHIGVRIKEGERALFIFLAREPDSERRYRPEARGSAQKGFWKIIMRALPGLLKYGLSYIQIF